MDDGSIAVLKGPEVRALLAGQELEVMRAVRMAYEAHGCGESSLPHSTFLRFPGQPQDRIIALPAYLGGDFSVAGIKWVASFPGNLRRGVDRASAILILNSLRTGHPEAVLEGSVISAKRTAASAALAARSLLRDGEVECLGIIGCGCINFETVRFVLAAVPAVTRLVVFDQDPARAMQFAGKCHKAFDGIRAEIAVRVETVLRESPLISIATNALTPHLHDLSQCPSGCVILHISLRDLAPEVILASDNVVDDIDHVCRAQTSVHLAEQLVGHRGFIRCTLADILSGRAPARNGAESVSVFSPFGLGLLDLAVGKLARDLAVERGREQLIDEFLPGAWVDDA